MVGDSSNIDVREFEWDESNLSHVAEHGVAREDVESVRDNAPRFFANLPNRSGTHVMVGPDSSGRFYYVVMAPGALAGTWRVITAYQYARRRALRIYGRDE